VEDEVKSLLQKQAVVVVPPCIDQFISWQFLVKDSSFRSVVNLKPLNTFIQKSHFKMEEGAEMPRDWMCSRMPTY